MGLAALSIFEPITISRGGRNQKCECVCVCVCVCGVCVWGGGEGGGGGAEELPDFISK